MRYLIVGLDPGITTGVCCLDLSGKLVKAYSSKRFGLDNVIEFLTKIGKPVIFACDVSNPPLLLEKITAIYQARLVYPKEDMKVGEKQVMVEKSFPDERLNDLHQRDACAAALFAFKKFYPLFDKVNFVLRREGLFEKSDEIKKKLLLGEAESIKDALVERPEDIMLQKKKRAKEISAPGEISILREDIKKQKELIEKMREENKKLNDKTEYLDLLLKSRGSEGLVKLAESRKHTIDSLECQISRLKDKIITLETDVRKRLDELAIVKRKELIPIKILEDLSNQSILKLNDSNFSDCLFVKNLTLPSTETKDLLQKLNIRNIIYEKENRQIISELSRLGFKLMPKDWFEIKEINNLFFVEKQVLKSALEKLNPFEVEKIIEEHRKRFSE
jgi:predicted RNase H-like nuclease (RuvC/YqgF family)